MEATQPLKFRSARSSNRSNVPKTHRFAGGSHPRRDDSLEQSSRQLELTEATLPTMACDLSPLYDVESVEEHECKVCLGCGGEMIRHREAKTPSEREAMELRHRTSWYRHHVDRHNLPPAAHSV